MKIAVFGATGLVGTAMIKILEERNFPVTQLIPVASGRSEGKKVIFKGDEYEVVTPDKALTLQPQIALFSAGSEVSKEWAPRFAAINCYVIDNSACWRMDAGKRLIIPEINGELIAADDRAHLQQQIREIHPESSDAIHPEKTGNNLLPREKEDRYIIANPNCSTIQMLVAIAGLHREFKIKRIVVSTYQCVTGTGKVAVEQMDYEREKQVSSGKSCIAADSAAGTQAAPQAYPYRIDLNLLPHIDDFLSNGYTKEEMKMVNETHKIMRDSSILVSPTTVRVPTTGGHAESINLEFEKEAPLEKVLQVLKTTPGVVLQNDSSKIGEKEPLPYPMPLFAQGRDEVFVGRVRTDPTVANGINLWCVADNLRKGAATNAVQIAELLILNKNGHFVILPDAWEPRCRAKPE